MDTETLYRFSDAIPAWAMGLIIAGLMLAMIEIGYRVGHRTARIKGLDKYPVEASASNTLLGLLAFLLAVTFGGETSRFLERRDLVLDEANALGTAYLRADFAPAEAGERARGLFRDYLSIRLGLRRHPERVEEGLQESERIQGELWSIASELAQNQATPVSALFVSAVNEVIDLHSARVTKIFDHRMPWVIWVALFLVTLIAAGMFGVNAGLHGRRSRAASVLLVIGFATVIMIVIDLDRPYTTWFTRNMLPLERLADSWGMQSGLPQ